MAIPRHRLGHNVSFQDTKGNIRKTVRDRAEKEVSTKGTHHRTHYLSQVHNNSFTNVQEIANLRRANEAIIEAERRKRLDKVENERLASELEEQRLKEIEEMMTDPIKYAETHHNKMTHVLPRDTNFPENIASLDESLLLAQELIHPTSTKKSSTKSGSKRPGHKFQADKFVDPNHEKVDCSSNKALKQSMLENIHTIKKEYETKSNLIDFKASHIKKTAPEVLNAYRVERAKEFINKQGMKSIEIPHFDAKFSDSNPAFRPGGVATYNNLPNKREANAIRTKAWKAKTLPPLGASNSVVTLTSLENELKLTEANIARQQLKIALNNNTPNYAKKQHCTVSNK